VMLLLVTSFATGTTDAVTLVGGAVLFTPLHAGAMPTAAIAVTWCYWQYQIGVVLLLLLLL
jgi:hypothetical protein